METGSSVTCSQEPTNCNCPQTNKLSPHPPSHFLKMFLILSSRPLLGLSNAIFPVHLPTKLCMQLFPSDTARGSSHLFPFDLITRVMLVRE